MSRDSETAVPSPSFSINLCWENEEIVLDEGIVTHNKSDPISTAELVHSVSAFLQRGHYTPVPAMWAPDSKDREGRM